MTGQDDLDQQTTGSHRLNQPLRTTDPPVQRTKTTEMESDPGPFPETPLVRSQAAYEADLPELLKSHRGEWVAYADGRQLRLANSQAELYRHCLKDLGLTHDRFIVRRVVPDGGSRIEFTLR